MRKLLLRRKKVVKEINRLMLREHNENLFEENQFDRAYNAGIIDGLGLSLTVIGETSIEKAPMFPLSISFYEEEDESCTIARKQQEVESLREKMFDLQNNVKSSLFYEEVD